MIWVQVLMLRAQIRAAYGRGVKYHWSVTPNLRVYLVSIDWIPGQKTEREWLKPSVHFSDRLAAACDGRRFMPTYAERCAQPSARDEMVAANEPSHVLMPLLPLPDT